MSRDRTVGETFYVLFTTRAFATGIPTQLAGSPVVSAYEDNSTTQITAGVTLGVDHDSVTGLNLLTIVATGGNGFEASKDYHLVITTGTVGGVSVVGEVVGEFSLGLAAAFTRLGAPAGASIAADLVVIDNFVDDIETRLGTPSDLGGGATFAANLVTIEAQTDDIGAAGAGLTALATQASVNTIDDFLDTEIADIRRAIGPATTTIATLASQTSFTLTAGSADDNAYNGWGCLVIDASSSVQTCLGVVLDYTGSTKTVTLLADPGIFTMATTDIVVLIPAKMTTGVDVLTIEGLDATDQLDAHAAAGLDAAGVRAAIGLASANLDTQLADLPTNAELATSQGTADDATLAAIATLQTSVDDLPTNAELATSQAAADDATLAAIATLQTTANDIPTNAELATALGTADDAVLAAVATVDTVVDGVAAMLVTVDSIVADLNAGIIYGAAATGTLSTTQATSDLTGYANDQLIGRVLIVLAGNAEGEATRITDYASASGLLTFDALTTAMGNGDIFKIV